MTHTSRNGVCNSFDLVEGFVDPVGILDQQQGWGGGVAATTTIT